MIDETKLRQVAKELKDKGGTWAYWHIEDLMGWLLHEGKCVYCRAILTDSTFRIEGQTDHLLPKAKYPELKKDYLNLVPACDDCHRLKQKWDPNDSKNAPQLYSKDRDTGLTREMQREFIDRVRTHIKETKEEGISTYPQDRQKWHEALKALEAYRRH